MIVGPQGPAKVGRRGDKVLVSMAKKFHKRLREIQRLQSLHGGVINEPTPSVGDSGDMISAQPATTLSMTMHQVIRKDLLFLFGVMAAMIVVLFVFKWLVDHTSLAQSIIHLGGVVK